MGIETRKPGVWETDAPAGYVGIVIYDLPGQLAMRIEVAERLYSPDMAQPLREWVMAHHQRPRLLRP